MFLKWTTNCLLFLILIYLPHTGGENVSTVIKGETVDLLCHLPSNDSEQLNVVWTKNSTNSATTCEWMVNGVNISSLNKCDPRFTLTREPLRVQIKDAQPSDSGYHSCKTTRIIPPPSLDYSTNMTLQVVVPRLSLQKLNSSNDTCVHLLCSIESLQSKQVNFTWSRGQRSLHPFTSNATESELRLCKPDWSEGDTITCYASYSRTQTNTSIQLKPETSADKDQLILIISCSAAAGLILCIILTVVICKCRNRDENGSMVFSNKVYENFSFAMFRQNAQSNDKPQPEECIYEN
ncbi:uncharacterized protein LOC128021135 isoform X4 [Carassius gibelio]|uniref:uncharacterized protein LOC128021135 isoform X4 n=1 Tax=Carassius gibelio TaxID=101364 RepID=UPI0022773FBC|nr:uncharacterized protein LOC128021135 isoform X4 [Carassius gibelio]